MINNLDNRNLDEELRIAFGKISEKLVKKAADKKEPESTNGFAIIGRYSLADSKPVGVEKVRLTAGKCVVFIKGGGIESFNQGDMVERLDKYSRGLSLETFAYIDSETGTLFFGRGKTYEAINKDTPKDKRVLNAKFGNVNYGMVWGESAKEAEDTLNKLIFQRFHGSN